MARHSLHLTALACICLPPLTASASPPLALPDHAPLARLLELPSTSKALPATIVTAATCSHTPETWDCADVTTAVWRASRVRASKGEASYDGLHTQDLTCERVVRTPSESIIRGCTLGRVAIASGTVRPGALELRGVTWGPRARAKTLTWSTQTGWQAGGLEGAVALGDYAPGTRRSGLIAPTARANPTGFELHAGGFFAPLRATLGVVASPGAYTGATLGQVSGTRERPRHLELLGVWDPALSLGLFGTLGHAREHLALGADLEWSQSQGLFDARLGDRDAWARPWARRRVGVNLGSGAHVLTTTMTLDEQDRGQLPGVSTRLGTRFALSDGARLGVALRHEALFGRTHDVRGDTWLSQRWGRRGHAWLEVAGVASMDVDVDRPATGWLAQTSPSVGALARAGVDLRGDFEGGSHELSPSVVASVAAGASSPRWQGHGHLGQRMRWSGLEVSAPLDMWVRREGQETDVWSKAEVFVGPALGTWQVRAMGMCEGRCSRRWFEAGVNTGIGRIVRLGYDVASTDVGATRLALLSGDTLMTPWGQRAWGEAVEMGTAGEMTHAANVSIVGSHHRGAVHGWVTGSGGASGGMLRYEWSPGLLGWGVGASVGVTMGVGRPAWIGNLGMRWTPERGR